MPLHLHARVRRLGSAQGCSARTEDLNCDGVCFTAAETFVIGELIEIDLELEGLLGRGMESAALVCLGKVVQAAAEDSGSPFRYRCAIVDYALQMQDPHRDPPDMPARRPAAEGPYEVQPPV
ncbi:MAG: hypothetical protein IT159_15190 [Bryobacterales bacterium]|nr:hypothetical protein [Bryobacterales bacterium]